MADGEGDGGDIQLRKPEFSDFGKRRSSPPSQATDELVPGETQYHHHSDSDMAAMFPKRE
ncbi:hypothetical protein [Granulibacter bethesdensis]|uniref:hypothetical protein n=1 Tax=Granulibacter bethesdensis TaxID=364410 RepID=UPI000933FF09|nr:hypothetical protein [Granulibacter bethesdensis]